MTSVYRFPPNANAAAGDMDTQLGKAFEELHEIARAYFTGESPARVIEETWDLIQTAEGILRKYDAEQVEAGRLLVLDKCEARGDYPADVAEQYRPGTKWDPFLGRDEILRGLVELMEADCWSCSAHESCNEHSGTCEETRARWLLEAVL